MGLLDEVGDAVKAGGQATGDFVGDTVRGGTEAVGNFLDIN